MHFEWDKAKSLANEKKHGVTFEEAQTVFFGEEAILFDDPDHSEEEERFILLGPSTVLSILVVVHCYREASGAIRIISARHATRRERRAYVDHRSRQ
jgi:uncharacterized protein